MILHLFLAAIISFAFNGESNKEDLIQWRGNHRLTWNDFQAVPPKDATNAALTSSSIFMKFGSNGQSLRYEISCNFDKKHSWGRVKNDHILSHEQGHFDVAEIYARKLNKALQDYKINENSVSKDVNAIYKREMEELWEMQTVYDQQTDYSRNYDQQKSWLTKIESTLEGLEEYADY